MRRYQLLPLLLVRLNWHTYLCRIRVQFSLFAQIDTHVHAKIDAFNSIDATSLNICYVLINACAGIPRALASKLTTTHPHIHRARAYHHQKYTYIYMWPGQKFCCSRWVTYREEYDDNAQPMFHLIASGGGDGGDYAIYRRFVFILFYFFKWFGVHK